VDTEEHVSLQSKQFESPKIIHEIYCQFTLTRWEPFNAIAHLQTYVFSYTNPVLRTNPDWQIDTAVITRPGVECGQVGTTLIMWHVFGMSLVRIAAKAAPLSTLTDNLSWFTHYLQVSASMVPYIKPDHF